MLSSSAREVLALRNDASPGATTAAASCFSWSGDPPSGGSEIATAELVGGPGAARGALLRAQAELDAPEIVTTPNSAQTRRLRERAFTARRKGRKVSILRR